jgi:hypothetical protein
LFANNISLFEPQVIPLAKDSIPKAQDEDVPEDTTQTQQVTTVESNELPESIKLLDHQEFLEYIECQGHWPPINAPFKNEVLINVVEDITQLTHVAANNLEIPVLPSVALTVSIVGKKFAGKSMMAQKLATKYGMDIIQIDELIKDAVR